MPNFDTTIILEAWLMVLNTFHFAFTVLFLYNFVKVILVKYTPYNQLYIAVFLSIQVMWNGCPIASFVNVFNEMGSFPYEFNGFFFGAFLNWTDAVRFISILMIGLMYWSAYETWFKVDYPLDFSSYFKKGDFKIESQSISQSDFQNA
jgi:hypothetical protein